LSNNVKFNKKQQNVSAFFFLGISQQRSCDDTILKGTCAWKGYGIPVFVCISRNWYSLRFSSYFQFTIQNNLTNRCYKTRSKHTYGHLNVV